jgi:predicted nucleic acid-binding protein
VTAIVDTGPLVALPDGREPHHQWARETLGRLETPLRPCEAVLSEACFLLRGVKGGRNAVLTSVSRGIVAVDFRLANELEAVRKLMAKYASVPMALADACLVRMAEVTPRDGERTLEASEHGTTLPAGGLLVPGVRVEGGTQFLRWRRSSSPFGLPNSTGLARS